MDFSIWAILFFGTIISFGIILFIAIQRYYTRIKEYKYILNFLKQTAGFREYLIITNYSNTFILKQAMISRDSIVGYEIILDKILTFKFKSQLIPVIEFILDAGPVSFLFVSEINVKQAIIELAPLFKPDDIIKIASFKDFIEKIKEVTTSPINQTIQEMKQYIESIKDLAESLNSNATEIARLIGAWSAVDDNILTALAQGFNEATTLEVNKNEFPDFLKRRIEILKERIRESEEYASETTQD